MSMRRAFTLVEMLIVMATLPIAAFVLDRFFVNVIHDIPRSSAVVQENTTLLNMLNQMRNDIDKAKRLPEKFEEQISNEQMLLIEQIDGVIAYELQNGKVIRKKLSNIGEQHEDVITWSLPTAELQWQVWKRNGRGYAVEVRSCVKQKLRKKWQNKLVNSHVYFLGVFDKVIR
jgi:prepilin-type N-terminal cleavage/methylation domain-containing protein